MPSKSGWGVWCFPGERVQVLVKRRNVEGKKSVLCGTKQANNTEGGQ